MVDTDWKAKMVSSDIPNNKSLKLSNKLNISVPSPIRINKLSLAFDSPCSAYEHYLRLPELTKLWSAKEFPNWENESILKPALQALEIMFRFISTVLSDSRSYANRREWKWRLESLTTTQIQLIALLCEDEDESEKTRGTAPIVNQRSSECVLARDVSSTEVWKLGGDTTVVSRTSEASLLPTSTTSIYGGDHVLDRVRDAEVQVIEASFSEEKSFRTNDSPLVRAYYTIFNSLTLNLSEKEPRSPLQFMLFNAC